MTDLPKIRYPEIAKSIVVLVGGFGSGKTEVAINLAKYLKNSTQQPAKIADLDLVNPYFRSREAIKELEANDIGVIAPRGGEYYADLPILLPEIKGLIEKPDGILVLDVGGDEQGSKALGSLSDAFLPGQYEMLMVLNSRRPQTANLDGCIRTMNRIEKTARLKFTGLISNSHMIDDTNKAIIREGFELTNQVANQTGLKLAFICISETLAKKMDLSSFDCPILPLARSMLKPWERKKGLA